MAKSMLEKLRRPRRDFPKPARIVHGAAACASMLVSAPQEADGRAARSPIGRLAAIDAVRPALVRRHRAPIIRPPTTGVA